MVARFIALVIYMQIFGLVSSCEKEEGTPAPVESIHANFVAESSIVKKESELRFENRSRNADSYSWDFGDNGTSTEEDPTHTYLFSGNYEVRLVASNDAEKDTICRSITVKDYEITVMSYNIAFSGGAVDYLYDMWDRGGHGTWNRDRRLELAEIINSVDPDVLGIQEAFCWDSYFPKVYVDFAELIGMPYVYYPGYSQAEWNGLCIYSKYPIFFKKMIFHQTCVPDQVWNGLFLLGARVELDSTNNFDFFSCHLFPEVGAVVECEVGLIHSYLSKDINPQTVLLGDMNWAGSSYYSRLYREVGLSYVYPELGRRDPSIPKNGDQIWVSDELYKGAKSYDKSNMDEIFEKDIENMLSDASDHKPVVARILF